jgi:hypothetical protein
MGKDLVVGSSISEKIYKKRIMVARIKRKVLQKNAVSHLGIYE